MVISDSLQEKRPEHLFLRLSSKDLQLYINGTLKERVSLQQNPLSGLKDIELQFGNSQKKKVGLRGSLSHIALYAGLETESQITQKAHMVTGDLEARKIPGSVLIDAELVEASAVPAPDSLGAYSRALVVNRYRVAKVQQGSYPEKEILVAQWAVLDRTVLPETSDFVPGKTVEIRVEKFDDHPELEGERLMMDMFDPDLEIYYQVDP